MPTQKHKKHLKTKIDQNSKNLNLHRWRCRCRSLTKWWLTSKTPSLMTNLGAYCPQRVERLWSVVTNHCWSAHAMKILTCHNLSRFSKTKWTSLELTRAGKKNQEITRGLGLLFTWLQNSGRMNHAQSNQISGRSELCFTSFAATLTLSRPPKKLSLSTKSSTLKWARFPIVLI